MKLDNLVPQPEPLEFNGVVYQIKKEIYYPATRLKYVSLAQAVEDAKTDNEKLDKNIELLEYFESFIDTDARLLTAELIHPKLMPVRLAIIRRLLAEINGEDISGPAKTKKKAEKTKKK